MNPHNENDRLRSMLASCFGAVQLNFRHLPLRFIIDPPQEFQDAQLARQIAIHLFATRFDVPNRRIADMTGLNRWTVRNALMAVDNRLDEPVFEAAYRRMAARAEQLYRQELERAAA